MTTCSRLVNTWERTVRTYVVDKLRDFYAFCSKLCFLTLFADDVDVHREILQEAAIMKLTSRQRNLEIQRPGEEVSKHDVIVTLLADLQQEQDKESEILMTLLPDKVRCYTLTKFMLNNSLSSVLSNSVYEDKFYFTSVGKSWDSAYPGPLF